MTPTVRHACAVQAAFRTGVRVGALTNPATVCNELREKCPGADGVTNGGNYSGNILIQTERSLTRAILFDHQDGFIGIC